MIAQRLLFSAAKNLREIRPGSFPTGRQMQVGWVKIDDFRQITGYISKMVQDRRAVSNDLENVKVIRLMQDLSDAIRRTLERHLARF